MGRIGVLDLNLTRVRACHLGRDQAPVDLRLHSTHAFRLFVAEAEADAALAVTYTDHPRRIVPSLRRLLRGRHPALPIPGPAWFPSATRAPRRGCQSTLARC